MVCSQEKDQPSESADLGSNIYFCLWPLTETVVSHLCNGDNKPHPVQLLLRLKLNMICRSAQHRARPMVGTQ